VRLSGPRVSLRRRAGAGERRGDAPRASGGLGLGLGLIAALFASSGSVGCAAPEVVRVIEGREVVGRFISEGAYAYYARAAQEEAAGGARERVLAALTGAAREDPESVEIWTKLGAAYCQAPTRLVQDAAKREEAFARAEARDARFSPLYRERARCALLEASAGSSVEGKRRLWQRALGFGERAVALDPEDLAATVLVADLLARLGREVEGGRLLAGFSIRQPTSTAALQALRDFAEVHGDAGLALRAERGLGALPFPLGGFSQGGALRGGSKGTPSLAALDAALGEGDLAFALRLAHRAHVPASEVAVRAAALGQASAARAEARTVLGADPGDGSAQVALAVALDLAGEEAAVGEALARAASAGGGTKPSPLARLVFAELLERRVSAEAARLFLGGAAMGASMGAEAAGMARAPGAEDAHAGRVATPGAEDALSSRVAARLAARLAAAR
jgi:hypothetical protein